MENIMIVRLEDNIYNIKIVYDLMLKDTSQKCFVNKDVDGNIVPLDKMAYLYLKYTDMFGIKLSDKYIGLLSLTNGNEISIFVEPKYQGIGIGKYSLILFEKLLRERYKLDTLVAEAATDNNKSINLLNSQGYKKSDESRDVPINGEYVRVFRFVKDLKNND